MLRLDGMYCSAGEGFVEILEVRLPVKEGIGCVPGVHDGPLTGKTVPKGAIPLPEEVEGVMEVFDPDVVGEVLKLS